MKKSGDREELIRVVATSLGVAGILAGAAVFGYQCFHWLQSSEWTPISLITAMQWVGNDWAMVPSGWLGLYRVLDFIPLAVIPLLFGIVLLEIDDWI